MRGIEGWTFIRWLNYHSRFVGVADNSPLTIIIVIALCPTGMGAHPRHARRLKCRHQFSLQPPNSNCATNHYGLQLLVGPFEVTESRIQQVMNTLSDRGEDNPNIAAGAREFHIPERRLRARWTAAIKKEQTNGLAKMKNYSVSMLSRSLVVQMIFSSAVLYHPNQTPSHQKLAHYGLDDSETS